MMVFSSPQTNFYAGRLYLGGSGSLSINLDDPDSDMDIYLNPEMGTFVVTNLLMDIGVEAHLRGYSNALAIGMGATYYIPLGYIVPYIGGTFDYTIFDDFNNNDGSMSVRALGGLDLFVTDTAAFFIEAKLPRYYIDLGMTSDWMYLYFGFHFYSPALGIGAYNI